MKRRHDSKYYTKKRKRRNLRKKQKELAQQRINERTVYNNYYKENNIIKYRFQALKYKMALCSTISSLFISSASIPYFMFNNKDNNVELTEEELVVDNSLSVDIKEISSSLKNIGVDAKTVKMVEKKLDDNVEDNIPDEYIEEINTVIEENNEVIESVEEIIVNNNNPRALDLVEQIDEIEIKEKETDSEVIETEEVSKGIVDEVVKNEDNKLLMLLDNYFNISVEEIAKENLIEEFDTFLSTYAGYFNMDREMILDAAHFITSNFEENMEMYTSEDAEKFALDFVYSIYHGDLKEYGYERKDFLANDEVDTMIKLERESTHVLKNGYTFNDFMIHVTDLIDIDPLLVLAISNHESGFQTSNQANNKNNFGGLRGKDGFLTFPTPEAGIICMSYNLKNIIEKYNTDEIAKISGVYVNGSISNPDETWIYGVKSCYSDLENNMDDYFTKTLKY